VEASLPLVVAAGDGFLAAWTEGGKGEGATVVAARLAEPVADGRAGLRPAEPLPTGVEGASAGERGRR
jgi:hypothetical protein